MSSSPATGANGFSLWQNAAPMAPQAHEGQHSPGPTMPYFAHCSRVAMLVVFAFSGPAVEIIAATYRHEVYEKTTLTREAVAMAMGSMVATLAERLSITIPDEKATYWERLAQAPWKARVIKIAHALDHLNGPLDYQKARLRSARRAVLLATGHEPAIERASQVLRQSIDCFEQSPS
ncbi:hypothetical protein [Luteolibacter soli]|uniref:Uncharacterized protein n=1 Tax=Luteolibacter soli TaxID=3135280 RepID=A0ABU9B3I1_9BACT